MRTYELVTILSPMLNQDQAAEAWGRIKEFITTREAEITREQTWGTRRLAYPIRKGSINFLEGSYYLTQFATERPFNFDLELFLNRDERVLRSLVTVADPNAPLAQPGMAAAAARAAAFFWRWLCMRKYQTSPEFSGVSTSWAPRTMVTSLSFFTRRSSIPVGTSGRRRWGPNYALVATNWLG